MAGEHCRFCSRALGDGEYLCCTQCQAEHPAMYGVLVNGNPEELDPEEAARRDRAMGVALNKSTIPTRGPDW